MSNLKTHYQTVLYARLFNPDDGRSEESEVEVLVSRRDSEDFRVLSVNGRRVESLGDSARERIAEALRAVSEAEVENGFFKQHKED